MAEIDVFHQLHCLNSLRKGLIHNYQYYWGDRYGLDPPIMFSSHLNHCMDVLRQNIMCHADVEVITYDWRETQLHPFPNFGINKKCRDFNAVLEWQERTKLQDARRHWYAFKKPDDAVQLPPPAGLKALGKGTGWHKGDGFHLSVPTQRLENLPHGLECSE
ncbi:putative tat pathway signal sequence protein [Neofusicoccum parvum UCRNP2]|uniref:Putative tat pathway signal sequence protein n=1 Tax=Botryosphaeria parva (strain UCR-NP2) TaxID=1287680 RepID=R1GC45_BOTPV|nr:putative tat pathway signal sequence protein [Neofusicoccum parvum UCRNP2]